jgi:hypothetical protein
MEVFMANDTAFIETNATPVSMTDLMRSEIDIQITTAKKYPRSIEQFRQQATMMATMDTAIAASCFYKLKRKGKEGTVVIEGPSVRLAEIVASSWKNLRFGARIIAEDARFVTAQGVAHDLENNVCVVIEVSRRITGSDGRRYSDDMIGVTKNAACAIALRNAIFKAVPFTYAKQIYEAAKKTAIGDAKTLNERRTQMVEAFSKLGVTVEQILIYCEKPSMEDIGLAEIEDLAGCFQAIRDNETTVDEQFKAEKKTELPPTKELSVRQKLEVAKAVLLTKKGKKAVEEIMSTLTIDLKDCDEKELVALTKKLEDAVK